jgi:hypothetical protein
MATIRESAQAKECGKFRTDYQEPIKGIKTRFTLWKAGLFLATCFQIASKNKNRISHGI